MAIASINPATGEILKTFDALRDQDLEDKLERAVETFHEYRRTSFAERAEMMIQAAVLLERGKTQLAETMTTEMGKPIKAGVAEAEKCAWVCRF